MWRHASIDLSSDFSTRTSPDVAVCSVYAFVTSEREGRESPDGGEGEQAQAHTHEVGGVIISTALKRAFVVHPRAGDSWDCEASFFGDTLAWEDHKSRQLRLIDTENGFGAEVGLEELAGVERLSRCVCVCLCVGVCVCI